MSEWVQIVLRIIPGTKRFTYKNNYPITKFPYFINEKEQIKNKKGEILRPFLRGKRKGIYPCVDLYKNKTRYRIDVHRLVALMFVPNLENKSEVNHLDLNCKNYNRKNLEWCTRSENEAHKNFMTFT